LRLPNKLNIARTNRTVLRTINGNSAINALPYRKKKNEKRSERTSLEKAKTGKPGWCLKKKLRLIWNRRQEQAAAKMGLGTSSVRPA